MMEYVTGVQNVLKNLEKLGRKKFVKVAQAVEESAAKVANAAKAGHAGTMAHSNERYENQTNVLTSSITSELTELTEDKIVAEVFTNVNYAGYVEVIYPFMFPALQGEREDFKRRVAKAME